jgi:prepilin peptidase CpaA
MSNIILFQDGLVLFLSKYFIEIPLAIALLLLAIAVVFDVKSHRIPNWLVFSGALIGLAYHAFSSHGMGAIASIQGLAVGLAAFMPLYLLRAMGAGDVKLMAMVGAYLGPMSTFGAVITVFIAGGVLALAAAIRNKALPRLYENLRFIMADMSIKMMVGGGAAQIDAVPVSAGKLPYAIAIAAGTAIHIYLVRTGHALLS